MKVASDVSNRNDSAARDHPNSAGKHSMFSSVLRSPASCHAMPLTDLPTALTIP
jgi:hypothetical protein